MPVGVMPNDQLKEGETRLAPGDALVVHSDGLLKTGEQMLTLADFAEELSASEDAAEMVRRLMARTPDHPPDDVTAVVLRRLRTSRKSELEQPNLAAQTRSTRDACVGRE